MDLEESFNLDDCCRTCMNATSNNMYNIFADMGHNSSIADVINKNTSLNVHKEDELPKKLCSKCFQCIKAFYEFCLLATAVDASLRKQIKYETFADEPSDSLDSIKVENGEDKSEFHNIADLTIKDEYCQNETKFNVNNNIENLDSNELTKVKLKCEICNRKFRKLENLNHHKQKHDGHIKFYTCDSCLKTYTDHAKFVKHLSIHQADFTSEKSSKKDESTEQKCDVCSLSFQSKNALSGHMRKHTKKGRVLACSICKKTFEKISHLKRHELSHEANHPYKCTLCPKTFALENTWMEHVNKHNGVKPHFCPICSKAFSHLSTLSTHIKLHIQEKPFLCPTCGKRFDSSTNLNQHMRRHQGLKLFACTLCPRKFVSKGELKSHNVTHTGERQFACEQCGSTFTKQASLQKHTMRHLGVKPHQCDACPMKFTCKFHLKRHYRIHTGEKPYKCDMCERAFTQSNDLAKHRRAHLGDNLYKCSQCTQSFRLKAELTQHISDHFISQKLEAPSAVKTADNEQKDTPLDVSISNVV